MLKEEGEEEAGGVLKVEGEEVVGVEVDWDRFRPEGEETTGEGEPRPLPVVLHPGFSEEGVAFCGTSGA